MIERNRTHETKKMVAFDFDNGSVIVICDDAITSVVRIKLI